MIKLFTKNGKEGFVLIFGLSAENLTRLQQDKPIKIDMTELGWSEGTVIIYAGDTEEKMAQQLKEWGMIDPDTDIKVQT